MDGAAEVQTSGGDRNVHLITHRPTGDEGRFRMSVRCRQVEAGERDGGAGFRIGVRNRTDDHRGNCFARGVGVDAGLVDGRLLLGGASADTADGDTVAAEGKFWRGIRTCCSSSGDQLYENHGGYGLIREPAGPAILNYLRKYYMFGWAFREAMRDRPTLCIPDDHDVFQGNIWGESGKPMDTGRGTSSLGGYREPARMVNVVQMNVDWNPVWDLGRAGSRAAGRPKPRSRSDRFGIAPATRRSGASTSTATPSGRTRVRP